MDAALFAHYQLHADRLFLLVHSGSRGLGDAVLARHTSKFQVNGLKLSSAEAKEYLQMHDQLRAPFGLT